MYFHCTLVKTFFLLVLSCKTTHLFRYLMICKIRFIFFLCMILPKYAPFRALLQQKHCGSWGLFPLVLSHLPSPNFHWCLVHAVTCANFLLLVKYYPSFSEVFAGLANKECLAVFYVTEVVFWTKPDLLMEKYFKML